MLDSSIHNEQEPLSGQSDGSLSNLNAIAEGTEIGYGHQTYHDSSSQQSEFDTTYGESIYNQNEYYGSSKDDGTDFSENYQYNSFPRAAHSVYELEAANGMNQDYVVQLSQVSKHEQSVNEGTNDNASGGVDVMNVILVAAECAPWSKTGKN
jgi:starch synthase